MCARLMQLRPSAASVAARQRLLRFIEQRLLSAEYLALLRDASGCGTASIVRVVAAGSAARGTSLAGRSDLDVRIVVRHPCDDSSVRAFWERGVLRALARKLFWDAVDEFGLRPRGLSWDDFLEVFADPSSGAMPAAFAFLGVQEVSCSVSLTRMENVLNLLLQARVGGGQLPSAVMPEELSIDVDLVPFLASESAPVAFLAHRVRGILVDASMLVAAQPSSGEDNVVYTMTAQQMLCDITLLLKDWNWHTRFRVSSHVEVARTMAGSDEGNVCMDEQYDARRFPLGRRLIIGNPSMRFLSVSMQGMTTSNVGHRIVPPFVWEEAVWTHGLQEVAELCDRGSQDVFDVMATAMRIVAAFISTPAAITGGGAPSTRPSVAAAQAMLASKLEVAFSDILLAPASIPPRAAGDLLQLMTPSALQGYLLYRCCDGADGRVSLLSAALRRHMWSGGPVSSSFNSFVQDCDAAKGMHDAWTTEVEVLVWKPDYKGCEQTGMRWASYFRAVLLYSASKDLLCQHIFRPQLGNILAASDIRLAVASAFSADTDARSGLLSHAWPE